MPVKSITFCACSVVHKYVRAFSARACTRAYMVDMRRVLNQTCSVGPIQVQHHNQGLILFHNPCETRSHDVGRKNKTMQLAIS